MKRKKKCYDLPLSYIFIIINSYIAGSYICESDYIDINQILIDMLEVVIISLDISNVLRLYYVNYIRLMSYFSV